MFKAFYLIRFSENMAVTQEKQSRCSAGLKIGEPVSILSSWCGRDGSMLATNISKRIDRGLSYPHVTVKTKVKVEPVEGETREETLYLNLVRGEKGSFENSSAVINDVLVLGEYVCHGFRDNSVSPFVEKKTCEGCPYQIL